MENNERGYPCPCCGFLTRSEPDPGTFEIFPVYNWEDDYVQFKDPNDRGGANKQSLNESKKNYKKFGAAAERFIKEVRGPLSDEIP